MRRTRRAFALAAATSLLAAPRLADACGGVFSSDLPGQSEVVTVTSQRIAISISSEQTVLWSQIAYEGDPSDFAWVLPVGPGAVLEASSDAWFEALEAFTATRVSSPSVTCYDGSGSGSGSSSGGCCGSALGDGLAGSAPDRGNFGQGGEVTVVHEGSVGNYQTVTLSSSNGEAVQQWLVDNGYAVPDTVVPALEAYAAQGLDFIAMRLKPDTSIKQMTPVRVRAPGGSTIVPMRMMAAGAGASVPLTLYVLGEGRYAPSNFPNIEVNTSDLTWDFATESSDYEARRAEALSTMDGRTFLTSHVSRQALHIRNERRALTPEGLAPAPENTADTIADLYALQGTTTATGEGTSCDLSAMLESYRSLTVVEACPDGATSPGPCDDGETVTASTFECGGLTDVSTALLGMRPRDLTLARLEANLPPSALSDELQLGPADDQDAVSSDLKAAEAENVPCSDYEVYPDGTEPLNMRPRTTAPALMMLGFLGVTLRRRRRSARA